MVLYVLLELHQLLNREWIEKYILALMTWCILAKLWLIPIIALAIGIPLAIKFRQYAGYILECCAFATAFASVIISKYWF